MKSLAFAAIMLSCAAAQAAQPLTDAQLEQVGAGYSATALAYAFAFGLNPMATFSTAMSTDPVSGVSMSSSSSSSSSP